MSSKKFCYRTIITDVIIWMFITLFIYAAMSKLLDMGKFEIETGKSPMLAPFVHWVIWLIPLVEVIVSILLLYKKCQLFALYGCFSLMTIFTGYIIIILSFSEYIPCSCGGILQNLGWRQHLIFNMFFALLAVAGILFYPFDSRTIAIGGQAENLEKSRH